MAVRVEKLSWLAPVLSVVMCHPTIVIDNGLSVGRHVPSYWR